MFSKVRLSFEIQIRALSFSSRFSKGNYHYANGLKSNRFNNKVHDPGSLRMKRRKMLLLSSSITKMNSNYLMYAQTEITEFLKMCHVIKVLFIPYALMDYDLYVDKVRPTFNQFGFELDSIHRHKNAERALQEADAIYIGGGNTFLLLKKLHDMNLITPIRNLVLINGIPYLGSSAGTNVATVNICTTNDMPIVHPPCLDALNLIPFNINPHYVEVRKGVCHTGETRDERIQQYLQLPGTPPVVGLREGAILKIEANSIVILGVNGARVFKAKSRPFDFSPGDDISFLIESSTITPLQHRSYV